LRKSRVLVILFCLATLRAFPQSTLQGTVSAEAPIPDANVCIQETGELTTTDDGGRFSMETADAGDFTLVVTAIGYTTYTKRVTLPFTGELDIRLVKETVEMETIHVQARRETVPQQARTAETVTREQIAAEPTAGDPFAVVDQEEGVVQQERLTDAGYTASSLTLSLSDSGRAMYSVYGADSDFNTYYYDYIRIPFNRHASGTDAPVIPEAMVDYMEISKGISPLEYGPGIGGFFRAVPEAGLAADSFLQIAPSTEQVGVVYKRKLSERSGLLLSATKSLSELTAPAMIWGIKGLYDLMGMSLFTAAPIVIPSYGDLCLRYFTAFDSQTLTLDLLGYYDWTRESLDMLGEYDQSAEMFPWYAAAGVHWVSPPLPSLLNDASASASLYRRTGTADMDMDLESFLASFAAAYGLDDEETAAMMAQMEGAVVDAHMHEKPGMSVMSFEARDSLSCFIDDATSLTAGVLGRYSRLSASYEADTDIDIRMYGFTMSQKYTVLPFEISEDVAKVHAFASVDTRLSQVDLHASAAYTWFPFHGSSAPSLDGEASWDGGKGWSASLRAGWSAGAYDEYAYLQRRMNEEVLGLAQTTSYAELPASVSATGKLVYAPGEASRLVVQPYFSMYYGLSGLAMYASYLDPYSTDADVRDSLSMMQMLDPDTGFSTGAGIAWQFAAEKAHGEISYVPSLTLYHNATGDTWFFPNNDVRHVVKGTCSFALPKKSELSLSLNLYMDKPFTPERVTDPANGTLAKEAFNSARDLVPRFTLGVKWEREAKLFGLSGRYAINCQNILAFLNPELVGMKEESLSVAGASTADFSNREYSFFRKDLYGIMNGMKISVGGTYSL
jgi:hypothetical protein